MNGLGLLMMISWPSLIKIVSGFERPEPILRGSKGGEGNTSDLDDNDYNPSDVSSHGSSRLNGEP